MMHTNILLRYATTIAIAAIVAGCGNGGASEPPITANDPAATSKLQFAVGVATLSFKGGADTAYGLNVVETLRQKDGLSGTLYNVPLIIGPTSFAVLTSTETGSEVQSAGSDLGTNHITWATLNQTQWTQPPLGPKASSTGAFGYGLCTCNSDSGPGNGFTPLYQSYNLPIYGSELTTWYGGPPAFPSGGAALRAIGWEGYSLGFSDFAVQPVIGKYSLYAAVPPSFDTPGNPTPSPGPDGTPTPAPGILAAGAQLVNLKALPPFAVPGFKPDGKGGGTVQLAVPDGASEALAIVRDIGGSGQPSSSCLLTHETDTFYTVVTHRNGRVNVSLPDNLGPVNDSGGKTPTICPGATYEVYAVGADWPVYESSYPSNLSQLPLIKGANGQADISTSSILTDSYPK